MSVMMSERSSPQYLFEVFKKTPAEDLTEAVQASAAQNSR